jgi:hypothetical protein
MRIQRYEFATRVKPNIAQPLRPQQHPNLSQRPTTADFIMLTHFARGFSLFAQSPQPVPRIGRLMISPPWGFLFTLNNKNSATSKAPPPPNNQQSHPRNKTYAQKPPLGGWGYNTAATTSQLFSTPYHGRF